MWWKAEEDIVSTAKKLIEEREELEHVSLGEYEIDYLMCDKELKSGGRPVLADIRAIRGINAFYIPYDYVVTIYEPNVMDLSDSQMQVLLLHELMHISEDGNLRSHDVQDFYTILRQFGLGWQYDADLKPTLGGEDNDS